MASVDGRRYKDVTSEGEMKRCGPCQLSALVKEADIFCRQCDEYMCVTCAGIHGGLKPSRNHTVIPCSGLHPPGRRDVGRHPLTFCEEHSGHLIQWFCKKHDVMLCDDCKVIGHRKCHVTSVSGMASGHEQQLADAISSMNAMKSRIGNLKVAREKGVQYLEKLQKSFEAEVEHFKSDIIELVDRLGREIMTEMKEVVSPEMDVLLNDVTACGVIIAKVETELRTADEAQTAANDVTSVIAAHNLTKTRDSLEATVSDMEKEAYIVNLTFEPSRALADVVTGVDRLGAVNIDRTATGGVDPPMSSSRPVHPASTRTSFIDMKVASSVDITCNIPAGSIYGSIITPDGRLVLADSEKRQIILLNRDFTIQSALTLQYKPWDVAADGDNDVIVSMTHSKQIQWIHVDGDLRAGRTVTTSHPCYGVAVHSGHIYISVTTGEYPCRGHVEVLTREGNVVRRIGVDASGARTFTFPYYITVGMSGNLYIADWTSEGRINCFSSTGDNVYDVTRSDMQYPGGMVVDEDGNLLVCCQTSNNVQVLAKDGSLNRTILTSADGVVRPYSMAYRCIDGTLIVTMGKKPYCRAYTVRKTCPVQETQVTVDIPLFVHRFNIYQFPWRNTGSRG